MKKTFSKYYIMLVVFTGMIHYTYAQFPPADTTGRILNIIKANRYNFENKDSLGNFISVAGNVVITQEKTTFTCDSAVLNQKENLFEAFGNIHINDNDSIHTYAKYLKYYGNEKRAVLKRSVRLTDRKAILTTNELEYNTLTKIGTYLNGGKVVNGKTVLTSTEGQYYGETKDVIFKRKVLLVDPQYRVSTDTLLYNTFTEIATFTTPTTIVSGKRKIKTKEGYYDMKSRKAFFGKRPVIEDTDYTLTADEVAFDDASGFGEAQGNAVYKSKDTANGYTIIANNLKSNNKTGAILATQKPLMIIKQGADSVYVTADTLYSGKITEARKSRVIPRVTDSTNQVKVKNAKTDSSTNRFFEAYYHVKIFTDSLQSISDSMFYSFEDSTFRLFKDPIVWAQGNQITGDTIYLYTQQKKPSRFSVFENALAINKVNNQFFNQVKGNTINGYFIKGNIDNLKAKGNAESIYYASDEDGGFIGVNRSTSDVIDMYFKERKLQKVVSRNNLKGTITPIRQANHNEMRVKGFLWQEEKRPKTKFELFGS
jgi:lipopolysaccharide assembly outer membrane protein LptD (OstA)